MSCKTIFNPHISNLYPQNRLRVCCHGLCITVLLRGVLGYRDDAGLHVVNIITQMLMQCKSYGSINFVFVHNL